MRPYTVKNLADLKVPDYAINGWITFFNQERRKQKPGCEPEADFPLTDLQSSVLSSDSPTLSGSRNLLIASPTSSGKTLVAQAIAATMLKRNPNAKILYLVPLRALVTEKYKQLACVLQNQIVVPLSTDYPKSDRIINSGKWNIAVLVFDKMYRWLTEPERLQELVSDVELIIVDELQVVEHQERGEKLESMLSFWLWHQKCVNTKDGSMLRPRLVGMTASETIAETVQEWLCADIVPDPGRPVKRPVPLYEGWMIPSKERYARIFSDPVRRIGLTAYPPQIQNVLKELPPAENCHRLAINLAVSFVRQKMRVLIYVATRNDTQVLATNIMKKLQESNGVVNGLDTAIAAQLFELEDSPVKEILSKTLRAGVGFHHGDMTPAERFVVEDGFMKFGDTPPISVVVATTTLSMGINLPADIVIMRDHHAGMIEITDNSNARRYLRELLTVLGYRNFAGRAGRYRSGVDGNPFGLALLLTEEWELSKIEKLLHSQVSPLVSRLDQPVYDYHPHVLVLLAAVTELQQAGSSITEETICQVLRRSYMWASGSNKARQKLENGIKRSLDDLRKLQLVGEERLTTPGEAAANHHLSYESAKGLLALVDDLDKLWPHYPLDLLYRMAVLPELQAEYPRRSDILPGNAKQKQLETNLRAYLQQFVPLDHFYPGGPFHTFIQSQDETSIEELAILIRVAATLGWLKGFSIHELHEYKALGKLGLGSLKKLGERQAFFISALRSMWEKTIPNGPDWERINRQLWLFEQSLRYGIPLDLVALPITVSYYSDKEDQRPHRRSYMKVLPDTGFWTDARTLIEQSCPSDLSTSTWDAIQQALNEWVSESQKYLDPGKNDLLMHRALEDLSAGEYVNDFAVLSRLDPKDLETMLDTENPIDFRLDEHTYEVILTRARRRIADFKVNDYLRLQKTCCKT